jgi:hypothetical protein
MLVLDEFLFIFFIAVGILTYWDTNRREKQIVYKAKISRAELGTGDLQTIKKLQEIRSRSIFGSMLMAGSMLLLVISKLIKQG